MELFTLTPWRLQLIHTVGTVLLAVLLFFPWIKIPPGTGSLVTQNALDIAFGRITSGLELKLGFSVVGIFYFFLTILTAIVGILLSAGAKVPWLDLQPYLRFRHLVMGGMILCLASLFILQILVKFPIEQAWTNYIGLDSERTKKLLEHVKLLKAPWLELLTDSVTKNPASYVGWSWGLYCSWLVLAILFVVVLLDFWQHRRVDAPPPRLLLEK